MLRLSQARAMRELTLKITYYGSKSADHSHESHMAVTYLTTTYMKLFISCLFYSIISVLGISITFSSSSIKTAQKSHQSNKAAITIANTFIQIFVFIIVVFEVLFPSTNINEGLFKASCSSNELSLLLPSNPTTYL